MNAEEFGTHIATLMKASEARHAAEMSALRGEIAELQAIVKAIPAPRDGRDGLPGVAGPAGEKGDPGKDGVLTVEEIAATVEYDGERTFKVFGKSFTLPVMINRGVFNVGGQYTANDVVTCAGSLWVCKNSETNRRPGDGSADWQLIVKAGRDGKGA